VTLVGVDPGSCPFVRVGAIEVGVAKDEVTIVKRSVGGRDVIVLTGGTKIDGSYV
jgi:hypothetical protein